MSHLTASGYKAEAVEKIFEKLDIDKSGCLSLEELIAGFANYTPLRKAPGFGNYNEQFKELIHADADALFNAIDGNNDGEITDAELRVHLRQFSNFSDAAITNIFSMCSTRMLTVASIVKSFAPRSCALRRCVRPLARAPTSSEARDGKVTDSLISVSTSTASNMGTTSVLPECIKILQNNWFPFKAHGPCGALAKATKRAVPAARGRSRPAPACPGARGPGTLSIPRFERTCRSVLRRAPPVPRTCGHTLVPWSLRYVFGGRVRPDARVFV